MNPTEGTATTPPTDWRKLVEELVYVSQRYKSYCPPKDTDGDDAWHQLNATLTRAKAALEETK